MTHEQLRDRIRDLLAAAPDIASLSDIDGNHSGESLLGVETAEGQTLLLTIEQV